MNALFLRGCMHQGEVQSILRIMFTLMYIIMHIWNQHQLESTCCHCN